jgi:hypothetical protein
VGIDSSHGFLFFKALSYQKKEEFRMAKGGHRRPNKRKIVNKTKNNDLRNFQRAKERKKETQKSKTLIRQMRGMKWTEEETDEIEEELDDIG